MADTYDLGAVTSVKVFLFRTANLAKSRLACFYKLRIRPSAPPRIPLRVKIRGVTEYADVVEMVDSVDLGAITSEKVFREENVYG